MEHRSFAASARKETGKGPIGRLRSQGRIPAVIYGGSAGTLAISLDERDYVKEHHGLTESTLVTIKLDGADHTVVVKDSQYDILSGKVLHVDFYQVEKGRNVRAHVAIRLIGTAEGVRSGGILENPTHAIDVECDPSVLPERIEVDISKLNVNQSIHVKDLKVDPAVKVLSSPDTVVVLVKYAKAEAVVEAAVAEVAVAVEPGKEGEKVEGKPEAKADAKADAKPGAKAGAKA
jgi:large subunit ribosomal protein L25